MIGFVAQRLMEMEVGDLTGAAYGKKSAEWLAQRYSYASGARKPGSARSSCASPSCAREASSRASRSRPSHK